MKKIGPILAILSGLSAIVLATLGILIEKNVLDDMDWIGNYDNSSLTTSNNGNNGIIIVHSIALAVGILQLIIGIRAFKNPTGVAAMLLFILFTATTTLAIISGVEASDWPTSSIISISITGVAAFGLLSGFLSNKK